MVWDVTEQLSSYNYYFSLLPGLERHFRVSGIIGIADGAGQTKPKYRAHYAEPYIYITFSPRGGETMSTK